MHSSRRPDIDDVLQKLLSFEISGQFCLTEVEHGLDAINLETTATLQSNGTFILHTPRPEVAKFMPPTSPSGIPCVAVVLARLIVNGEDHGIKPFLVSLNDGVEMSPGIISKVLPPRGGTDYVGHCITSFTNVVLPHSALLGNLEKPADRRKTFFASIDRVVIGSLSMAALCIPGLKLAATIAARYSRRRKAPIFTAIAQALVLESCLGSCVAIFTDPKTSPPLRHCIAAIAKTVIVPQSQAAFLSLSERCGARGVFEVNQITKIHGMIRGNRRGRRSVLSIRFASEILLGRIDLPPPVDINSPLARHEAHIVQELRDTLRTLPGHQAIGHRMAYQAACHDQLDQEIINLYVASCFRNDSGWYIEHGGISLKEQRRLESDSLARLSPRLDELLKLLDVDDYIQAPIDSQEKWDGFVKGLVTYRGVPTLHEEADTQPRLMAHL